MTEKYRITVSGKVYEVEVERISGDSEVTSRPQVVKPRSHFSSTNSDSFNASTSSASSCIRFTGRTKCPNSRKVFKIVAKPGDAVKPGDLLLIIEAMKMENEITAEFDGTIAAIPVNEGDNVAAGDVLVRFS
ncbi:MAG: acetyl-CoA carboxylase biotin carboxyl carrier protein subunit [Caldisericia bacterium]